MPGLHNTFSKEPYELASGKARVSGILARAGAMTDASCKMGTGCLAVVVLSPDCALQSAETC